MGFWIAIFGSAGNIPFIIIFIIIRINPIQKYIENQMKKYHYSITNEEKNNDMENIEKNKDNKIFEIII